MTSYEVYDEEFSLELRNQIRKRDNYQCQICGSNEKQRLLTVHHIDYNKKNNRLDNLICLCGSCHGESNGEDKEYFIDRLTKNLIGRNLK